jgi:outer membrane protein TolC
VLDAERTLLERENERAAGRTEAETNLVAVYRALGGSNAFARSMRR